MPRLFSFFALLGLLELLLVLFSLALALALAQAPAPAPAPAATPIGAHLAAAWNTISASAAPYIGTAHVALAPAVARLSVFWRSSSVALYVSAALCRIPGARTVVPPPATATPLPLATAIPQHVLDVLRTLYQATGLRQASAPWVLFYIWLAIGFVNAVLLVTAACRGPAIHAADRDLCLPSYANATITVCSSTPAYEASDAYALAADDAPHAAAGSMDIFCHTCSSSTDALYNDCSSSTTAPYSNHTAFGGDTYASVYSPYSGCNADMPYSDCSHTAFDSNAGESVDAPHSNIGTSTTTDSTTDNTADNATDSTADDTASYGSHMDIGPDAYESNCALLIACFNKHAALGSSAGKSADASHDGSSSSSPSSQRALDTGACNAAKDELNSDDDDDDVLLSIVAGRLYTWSDYERTVGRT